MTLAAWFRFRLPELVIPPDWRLATGRDWRPLYATAQTLTRRYDDPAGRTLRIAHHMPGGVCVSVHRRHSDGRIGKLIAVYFAPEAEAAWPTTRARLLRRRNLRLVRPGTVWRRAL